MLKVVEDRIVAGKIREFKIEKGVENGRNRYTKIPGRYPWSSVVVITQGFAEVIDEMIRAWGVYATKGFGGLPEGCVINV